MRGVASSLDCDLDEVVSYAPPRRRLTTGSHAEFVGALVHEFNVALASLEGDRQVARVAWLVRVLEAVDGDGSSRRVEPVHGATVARQAAAAHEMIVEINRNADRDDETFLGDPERVRLGLEMLFEALHSPAGSVAVAMPVGGYVTAVAPALDLDEPQRRFALRSAFRVLDMEGCQLRVRSAGDETRVEVRLGPRRK
ncbi:MAG TPA: hypothetical protein VJS45_15795 [Acidimicrobiia bacterium]|nr:hypothetical protein [Acidimicrobiia bacterium]